MARDGNDDPVIGALAGVGVADRVGDEFGDEQ